MYFRMLHDADSGAMTYLLAELSSREAVLIDPRGADAAVLTAMLAEHRLQLRWVLRTHDHDAQHPRPKAAPAPPEPVQAAHEASPGATLTFGHEHLRVLPTPGHTPGCRSYLWRDRLFCGCLLGVDTCPRQPCPALPQALWDSVHEQVFTLPAETLLWSGHLNGGRAVSTVLEERRSHPWFARLGRDEFLTRVRSLRPALAGGPLRPLPPNRHARRPAMRPLAGPGSGSKLL